MRAFVLARAQLHLSRARAKLYLGLSASRVCGGKEAYGAFLLRRNAGHAQLLREKPKHELAWLKRTVHQQCLAEAALLPYRTRQRPLQQRLIEVRVACFASPVRDDAVVAAQVALA